MLVSYSYRFALRENYKLFRVEPRNHWKCPIAFNKFLKIIKPLKENSESLTSTFASQDTYDSYDPEFITKIDDYPLHKICSKQMYL